MKVGYSDHGGKDIMKTIEELDVHIYKQIQGVFSTVDMQVLKEEIEKLQPGDVYVEIGVDEGRSARVAHEYANPSVYKFYIDIHDVPPHSVSIGRGPWMEQEGMVGIDKKGFFIHGDADLFGGLFHQQIFNNVKFVDLMFIDGHHDYESVKMNTQIWEPLMKPGSTILFHDYDHPDTKRWLDERYGDNKEVLHSKIVRVRK